MYGQEDNDKPIQQGGMRALFKSEKVHPEYSVKQINSVPISNENREKVIKRILNPKPTFFKESSLDNDKLSFMQGKTMKLAILVFFFLIFRSILFKIYDFFDVDVSFSHSMTAWLGVVILLWVALPSKLSVLKKTQTEKEIILQKGNSKTMMGMITGLFIAMSLMTTVF